MLRPTTKHVETCGKKAASSSGFGSPMDSTGVQNRTAALQSRQPMSDKQHILNSIAAIARGLGRAPTRSEFVRLAKISEYFVSQCFPSWNDAVRSAGLHANTMNVRLEDSELLKDWGETVRANRVIPARRAYRREGKYDPRTLERRFGPWSSLPQVFLNFAKDKTEWGDVAALLPAPVEKQEHESATAWLPQFYRRKHGTPR